MAVRAKSVESPHEELVYAPAIPILANDLYPRKLEILREYIQNANDALDAFQRVADHVDDGFVPQIKISIQGKSLLIWDNGIGMDGVETQKLRRIAYSEKREDEQAGHKGIGRLAGIAVARKFLISSTSYGDPELHVFEFRAKDLLDELAENRKKGITETASRAINRHTSITTFEVDSEDHYTLVELRDIDERHGELLDPSRLREFIADIAPVGFAPDFRYGERISEKLFEHLPDYSPKTVWLTTASGDRSQVYKPYNDEMELAEPEFIEVGDPTARGGLIAYCWCAVRGKEMVGKVRPSGGKFIVPGNTPDEKKRLAGLVYKLFGFSVGDRNLPLRTLWAKDYTRALWFTGEIHIVDKKIKPTTDRSDFIDNAARARLFSAASKQIAKRLNARAEEISSARQSFDIASKAQAGFRELQAQLDNGGVERAELKARRDQLRSDTEVLKQRQCKDRDIQHLVRQAAREGRALEKRLDAAKTRESKTDDINDVAQELQMTPQARKVYRIVMEAAESHFGRKDRDAFYELSGAIVRSLRKKY